MLDNPIPYILQAQQQKNKNWQDAINQLASAAGQFGGNLAEGMHANAEKQKWSQAINEMMMNPNIPQEAKNFGPLLGRRPELAGQILPEIMKQQQGTWQVVPNMLTPEGMPIQQNRKGDLRPGSFQVTPTGRGNSAFGVGSIVWDKASPQEQDIARGIYEGRIQPGALGYKERSIGVKLADEYAHKFNLPPFKSYAGNVAGKTAEAFATGKPGMNALSLNTALGHVDAVYDGFQKIANTDTKWLNRPLNKIALESGDPNLARLGVSLNALRGELATVFKGSAGTDQEIESWMKYLSDDLTPAQVNAVIPQVDELLRSRLSALDYQRQSGMGGRAEAPLLSPKAAKISKRLGEGSAGGSEQKVQKNGKTYVKRNGQWFEQ